MELDQWIQLGIFICSVVPVLSILHTINQKRNQQIYDLLGRHDMRTKKTAKQLRKVISWINAHDGGENGRKLAKN